MFFNHFLPVGFEPGFWLGFFCLVVVLFWCVGFVVLLVFFGGGALLSFLLYTCHGEEGVPPMFGHETLVLPAEKRIILRSGHWYVCLQSWGIIL